MEMALQAEIVPPTLDTPASMLLMPRFQFAEVHADLAIRFRVVTKRDDFIV